MKNRILQALTKIFERYRIVFWYDSKKELRDKFEELELPDIEKLELTNNEYGIKYYILREKPHQKFLIYREGPQPAYLDNWLLDVQLAQGEFSADQVAIWLSELELSFEFSELVQAHEEFYRVNKRKEALKRLLKSDDTQRDIRLKLLAVCAGSDPRMDAILENLLEELADDGEEKIKLIYNCKLDGFLWEQMFRHYGYKSKEPGINDFMIEMFKSCYAIGVKGNVKLNDDLLVFLKRWKNSRVFETGFKILSEKCADVLGIEQELDTKDFRKLMDLDYFRLIDQKIISDLVKIVATRTASNEEVTSWIRQRRQSHWYNEFQHIYEAIDSASQFIYSLETAKLSMDTLTEGIQFYCKHWYRLDQLYRDFVYQVQISGKISLMGELNDQIENLYSNNFLLRLNDHWQTCLDQVSQWDVPDCVMQKDFFKHFVQPINKKGKVCVLISDALRYEIGEELARKIRSANKYEVDLECIVSSLPSYTQLGMAALLPHKHLSLADDSSGHVLLDNQSTVGTIARGKLLKSYNQKSAVLQSEEVLNYNRDQLRELCRENEIIYVYHNRIDVTGDNLKTEGRVFEAVDKSIDELSKTITKLGGENYISQFIVTSDHGFIYQDRAIDESDYIGEQWDAKMVQYQDRRFIMGKKLPEHRSFKRFESCQLGLEGDIDVQIPKSINRLRLKGSGSRFVHGGASLQEVVVPVLLITKKKKSDISYVEVDILQGSSAVITSGQIAVAFYQKESVTDKVKPRVLRAGIYMKNGEIISDSHEIKFDLTSDNPRDREFQKQFVLTRKADDANNQEVFLKLEEKHAETSHYKEYKSLRYGIRRSFTSDFDF